MTENAIGGEPNSARQVGFALAAANASLNPGAASARCVLRNAVLPIESAPGNARPQASGVSGIRKPARPNTGAPAGVRMNALHRGNAPGAVGIRTSRIVGCAQPAGSGNAGATGTDTRKPAMRGPNTAAAMSTPGDGRPG